MRLVYTGPSLLAIESDPPVMLREGESCDIAALDDDTLAALVCRGDCELVDDEPREDD